MARRRIARGIFVLIATAFVGANSFGLWTQPVPAARAATPVNWEYKGFSLPAWDENSLANSGPALEQLAATGANSVTFVVTWYQASVASTAIYRTSATSTDAALIVALQKANALGLKVILKPHVDSQDGQWRANIDPADTAAWFANYAVMLDHYADLGRQYNVATLCIGAELITMSTAPANEARWRALVSDIRGRFPGKLTYSANWGSGDFAEEFTRISFWDALDYLGISAYFVLADTNTPTVASIKARWADWQANKIGPFHAKWGKPVLFTEGGYRSADGTAREPFNAWDNWPLDTQEQVDCWEALFESWANVPWFVGGGFWSWNVNTNISPTDIWYEVQNKPAQQTITTWFGGSGQTPQQPPTVKVYNPASNGSYSGTITVKAFATNATAVVFRVDEGARSPLALNQATALWEASLSTASVPPGQHTVTVTATSQNGIVVEDRAWNVQFSGAGATATSAPSATATATPRATATSAPSATPIPSAPPTPQIPRIEPSATPRVPLAVSTTSGGSVLALPVADGNGTYPVNASVRLTGQPGDGKIFIGWVLDDNAQGWAATLTVSMNTAHQVRALFVDRPSFSDVTPQTTGASEAIAQLAARGVIKGCDQSAVPMLFCPDVPSLRSQMAVMIVRAMDWGNENPRNPFTDRNGVDDELWRAVAILAGHGVAKGYGDGTFGTIGPVLNAQVVSFITRAMEAKGYWQPQNDDGTIYPNIPSSSGHRQDLATFVYYAGAVCGAENVHGAFNDWSAVSSRSYFAFLFWQALNSYFGGR